MTFVEGQGGFVINGGFKVDGLAVRRAETLFGGGKEFGTDPEATGFGENVDGNDVPDGPLAGFSDDESDDIGGAILDDDGESPFALDIGFEFQTRVGNALGEALLVDFPQSFEVCRPEVTQGEIHPAIVNGVCASST